MAFAVLGIVALPACAFAWGPLTHVYLGTEILYMGAMLPAAIYRIIKKYRQDYLYGNLMADTVLAKKYMDDDNHCHSWETGFKLLELAQKDSERAFCYGYLSHLAADTVAHGKFTRGDHNLGHAFRELRADSTIHHSHWFSAINISREVQRRGDKFLGRTIEPVIFSFNVNARIFKSVIALSLLNSTGRVMNMQPSWSDKPTHSEMLEPLHQKSLQRIVDVLSNGRDSWVIDKDPVARIPQNRFLRAFLSAT